jgi:hypothetical protein
MRDATTSDHLPPACLFSRPRPNDLVTVPACFNCNNAASKDDEAFRVFLSAQIGMATPAMRSLWKDGALRTLRHNNRLKRVVVDEAWEVDLQTPSGQSVRKARAFAMPVRSFNVVIDRIVRGLYYHHFASILGRRATCRATPLTDLPQELGPFLQRMSFSSVGGNAFAYRYSQASGSPMDSLWLLLFYERYLVMAETRPKSRAGRVPPNLSPSTEPKEPL